MFFTYPQTTHILKISRKIFQATFERKRRCSESGSDKNELIEEQVILRYLNHCLFTCERWNQKDQQQEAYVWFLKIAVTG